MSKNQFDDFVKRIYPNEQAHNKSAARVHGFRLLLKRQLACRRPYPALEVKLMVEICSL